MNQDSQYLKDYNEFIIQNPEYDIRKLPAIWKSIQIKLAEDIPDGEIHIENI